MFALETREYIFLGESQDILKTDTLNTTAYRVFKIVQWLQETPLSIEELNQRFYQDVLVHKYLSADSIWLYINTLKMLGCEITRPARTNGYRYELLYHPFGISLNPEEIQTLIRVKAMAEEHFSYQQVLQFDRFLKKILHWTSLPDREEVIQEIFTKSRSIDYEPLFLKIEELQEMAQHKQLLMITYRSPMKGKERFYFLPQAFIRQRGVLYLRGSQLGRENPVLLRLELIQRYEAVEQTEIYQQLLLQNQALKPTIVFKLIGATPASFEPFGLGETFEYMTDTAPHFLYVTVQTRDFFLLKQKLLETGFPFKILEPESFRNEMLNILSDMNRVYADDPE